MARKGLLTSVTVPDEARADAGARADYARRGASRAMMLSLDEIAQNSSRLLDGDAVVSLDPALIDPSPVADRMKPGREDDEADYKALLEAMRADGQASPILVRPHPSARNRYMVVFGRRRLRAAKELGVQVRAIVKPLEDVAAIIAQGQENSARSDLSFIERALFARQLVDLGHTRQTVKAALTVDDTLLSRMLSVTEVVPKGVINALGPSHGVGRDRWEELKKLVLKPSNADAARWYVQGDSFRDSFPALRFNRLLDHLKENLKQDRKPAQPVAKPTQWWSVDSQVKGAVRVRGKTVDIWLEGQDSGFGVWLGKRLDEFYRAYVRSQNEENGD